jgi:uncharacterized membrane protein
VPQDLTQSKLTQALAWAAAVLFTLSWFSPVLEDLPGWMAFRYALSPLVPYRDAGSIDPEDAVPQVLSALTNVVFVILLVLWASRQSPRPGMFVRITLACFLLNLYWLVKAFREDSLADLLWGYYAWLAAFALLLAVSILIAFEARRTLKTPRADTPS